MSETVVRLREWETRTPGAGPDDPLRGQTLDDAGRALAQTLRAREMLDVRELREGIEIRSFSYVGRVRLGDLTITVAPKLDGETLLALFSYAYGLRHVERRSRVAFETDGELLMELLIDALHDEAEGLWARGLPRRYRPYREDLASPRGRIDLNALARHAVPRAVLPCEHHLRSVDWAAHRVLVAGLQLASATTTRPATRIRLLRLATHMAEEVSPTSLHGRGIAEALRGLDRSTRVCEPALRLVATLHEGRALSLDETDEADKSVTLPGFLYDMNRFFQALLSRFLAENLADHEVLDERALRDLLRYAPDANPRGRRAPRPRPDFAIRRGAQTVALLDAKYRDLWEHSLPREMLYQLALYALSQSRGAIATILYPVVDPAAREARVEVGDPMGGWGRAFVALRPVAVRTLRDLIDDDSTEGRMRRRTFAWTLAFGASGSRD